MSTLLLESLNRPKPNVVSSAVHSETMTEKPAVATIRRSVVAQNGVHNLVKAITAIRAREQSEADPRTDSEADKAR